MPKPLFATLLLAALAAPAFAGEAENKVIATKALTEVFDAMNPALIDEIYAPGYIQHNPGMTDGRDGLRAALDFMQKNGLKPQRKVIRVLARGDLVAVQSQISFDGQKQDVVYDIFRFLGGQIIEHWDLQAELVPAETSANGHSMIDGGGNPDIAISATDLERNQKNALDFLRKGFAGDVDLLKGLFGAEYIQHNPQVPNGPEPVRGFLANGGFEVVVYQAVSDGDLTLMLSKYPGPGEGTAAIDMFRHNEAGKIVEHWDALMPIPAPDAFAHGNGFF